MVALISTEVYSYGVERAATALPPSVIFQEVPSQYPSVSSEDPTAESLAIRGKSSTDEFLEWPDEAPKTHADMTIAQLLRFEELNADWDGNSAAAPISESLNDAREFIRSLSPDSIIPRATLHAGGNAVLLLSKRDTYVELEFLGHKKIGFYAKQGDKEWGDEEFFNYAELPEGLSQVGFVIER